MYEEMWVTSAATLLNMMARKRTEREMELLNETM